MLTPKILKHKLTLGMVLLLFVVCSILLCEAHSAGGGNPSTYGSYNNYPQQWPPQQQQQFPYPDNDQYRQQQQYQPHKSFERAEPNEQIAAIQELPPLPLGWSEHIDPTSGQPYYYNMIDGTTTWDRPSPVLNITVAASEDSAQYQEQHLDNVQASPSLEQDYSKPIVASESTLTDGYSPAGKVPESSEDLKHSNELSLGIDSEGYSSVQDENVLTAVTRDEQHIRDEESWRASRGWSHDSSSPPVSAENDGPVTVSPQEHPQQPGWGLPSSQVSSDGWGIPKTQKPEADSVVSAEDKQPDEQQDHFRHLADPNPFPQQQQQQQQQQQHIPPHHIYSQGQKPTERVVPGTNFSHPGASEGTQPISRGTYMDQQDGSLANRGWAPQSDQGLPPVQRIPPNQQNIPPYQQYQQQQQQRPPPQSYVHQSLPPDSSRLPHQQGPPYHQSQPRINPSPSEQRPLPQQHGGYMYGQRPPQPYQYPSQYGQQQDQYPGSTMYGQQPPKQASRPSYGSQASQGQLISQDQQNLVKESIGRTWQSILGWRDRTKEVVESATSTVAQSARDATQTITEKGTGWWGQAKSVLGSVFESEPSSEYSLSGIYGNSPPSASSQGPVPGYPQQSQFPPTQSRYPPQQQYPPREQGQQQIPPQGRFPPGYSPPQPRVDSPYPYQQQGPRQEMPPMQRQYGPGGPHQGYPPQNRPYDPNRPGYYQQMPSGQRMPPSQQQQQQQLQQQSRKEEDKTNPNIWTHPGLSSDY